jgi:hypothetical protein
MSLSIKSLRTVSIKDSNIIGFATVEINGLMLSDWMVKKTQKFGTLVSPPTKQWVDKKGIKHTTVSATFGDRKHDWNMMVELGKLVDAMSVMQPESKAVSNPF